jgi:hypothetical protein
MKIIGNRSVNISFYMRIYFAYIVNPDTGCAEDFFCISKP